MSNLCPTAPLQVLANPFLFNDQEVRTAIGADSEVWWCAKDVATCLEIAWTGASITLKNMPTPWQGVIKLMTPKGEQDAIFINEAGVYRLAFRSNKPRAVEFTNWVCAEVLPAIRKHGFYGTLSHADIDKNILRITHLCAAIPSATNPFTRTQMVSELRYRCNLTGWKMPDLQLLDDNQPDMFGGRHG